MFERSVPDENDSSGSSRLASFSPGGGECSGKRLTPAPAMQRELSSRSNDGFLFQPEEECETHYTTTSTSPKTTNNHSENIPMYTPHDQPRGHRQQLTIVPPRPFSLFPLDHDTYNTTSRRGSRDKATATAAAKATTAGLMLESPWKSPGWKVREEKSGGGRNRSGSLLGMSAIDTENGEIPGLSQRLSSFHISKRRLSTSPKASAPAVIRSDARSPNVKKSKHDTRSSSTKYNTATKAEMEVDGLPRLHLHTLNAQQSFSSTSVAGYEAISPLSPTFGLTSLPGQHHYRGFTPAAATAGGKGKAGTGSDRGAPSSSGLPSRRYIAQPRALRLSVTGTNSAVERIEKEAKKMDLERPAASRGVLASPFGIRLHSQQSGSIVSPRHTAQDERMPIFGPGRRGTMTQAQEPHQDSIEEDQLGEVDGMEVEMDVDMDADADVDVQSSVKRRIRQWAMDTMQRAASPATDAVPFLDNSMDGSTSTSSGRMLLRTSTDESLHPPELPSHPSGETVNTITTTTTDSSGGILGIEASPTPLHGVKRELVAYPRSVVQYGQIGLGIFAGQEEQLSGSPTSAFQGLKRGKRDLAIHVDANDATRTSTSSSRISLINFNKSHSSPVVPTLNSIGSGSGTGDDERLRKTSLTDSVASSVWRPVLSTRASMDEQGSHSRKTSGKLSFSSIKGLSKKPSPLLEYRSQFTPPPVRPTLSPQLNGPDGPPSPFEASSESNNSRCNSFLRELQASTSRPPIARRTTAPARSSPKESNDLPPLPANSAASIQGHIQSQLPPHLVGTPVHMFDSERPSPAAFMSTGLIKKGSGFNSKRGAGSEHSSAPSAVNSSGSISNAFERVKGCNMLADSPLHSAPDTPIKYNAPNTLISSHKQRLPPLKFGNSSSTAPIKPTSLGICTNPSPESDDAESKDDQSSLPTGESNGTIGGNSIRFPVGPTRGLRRKGSAMWARTNSGNWSNGSWSRQTSFLVDEDEPLTPTRNEDRAVVKLDFSTITPSPPAPNARHYPFASSSNLPRIEIANSPTSPLKKGGFLSRLPKHRALARVSNPLLSAAYKLGEQQANIRAMAFGTPSADNKHKLKIARRVSTSSLGGTDSKFERDFVLLGPIGVGEFSTVWKVREKRDGTVWAVKRGKPYVGEKDRTRQLEEVAILSTLAAAPHSNILQFQEAWEEKRQLHIRTALADCGDFATYLQSISDDGGLDEGRSWKVLHELLGGLRHIHSLGILHLDLKPANILIDQSGTLQISDFGLSIRLASLTSDGYPVVPAGDSLNVREGDREYLSPEMLEGVYGTFSDVFSLGATMLEVAFNIVLPSNGDAWQKLRNNDFSDLEEHCGPFSLEPRVDFHSPLGTSNTSSCTLASTDASRERIGNVSFALFSVIRGMMNSDHTRRLSLRHILDSAPIIRLRSPTTSTANNISVARLSVESRSRSSVDEWEEWSRQRARDNELSPDTTKVESRFIEFKDDTNALSGPVKPALVLEDPGFLDKLLA
ncbi:hypothetical protein QFC24_003003 [Naganishia onofrii]|uniref:Uncharacterized protein n=1 Tax=Naganishia onofrii TaxID=1851511 RepID=A0ACC2XMP0_9TREE|nr:hypothetical protein QFC24_003003 [Naganishia onofrii]